MFLCLGGGGVKLFWPIALLFIMLLLYPGADLLPVESTRGLNTTDKGRDSLG